MASSEDAGIDCKICRGPPEPGAPLYSPCKCKGSIGSVHESCLFDWLEVNGKSSRTSEKCEVCGTPFRFQKVYRQVPQHLPYRLVAKQIGRTVVWAALLLARFALVAFCWIGLVPWCTVWTFRFLLFTGTSLTYVLTGAKPRSSPVRDIALDLLNKTQDAAESKPTHHLQITRQGPSFHLSQQDSSSQSQNATVGYWDGIREVFANAGKDCFTGQIIMCAVVVVFIAVFLLREWINQQQPADDGVEVVPEVVPANTDDDDDDAASEDSEEAFNEQDTAKIVERLLDYHHDQNLSVPALARIAREVNAEVETLGNDNEDFNKRRYVEIIEQRIVARVNEILASESRNELLLPWAAAGPNFTFTNWSPPEELGGIENSSRNRFPSYENLAASSSRPSAPLMNEEQPLFGRTPETSVASSGSSQSSSGLQRVQPLDGNAVQFPEGDFEAGNAPFRRRPTAPGHIDLPSPPQHSMRFNGYRAEHQESPEDELARVVDVFDDKSSTTSDYQSDEHETLSRIRPQGEHVLDLQRDEDRTPSTTEPPREARELGAPTMSGTSEDGEVAHIEFAHPEPLQDSNERDEDDTPDADRDLEGDGDADEGEDDNWMDVFEPQDEDAMAAEAAADDAEAGLDDFDGILEAVGLKGNLFVLFQTVALMHLFITVFLTATVWLPFIVGRLLLGLNAFYYLFVGPVKVVRTVTDPLVDYVTLFLMKIANAVSLRTEPILSYLPALPASSPSTEPSLITKLFDPLKPQALEILAVSREIWINMAHNDEPLDRILCITLGYISTGLLAALWYYRDSHLERPWSRPIQHHIASYGTLLKVAMFVVVELIAFPVVCGLCLNFMSLPLFKDASIASRIAFQARAPYSSGFLHWAAGTLFMFVVAQWIALCRSTFRKGALFFIRDPRDPEAHPIKEMVEQSISTQFSKLGKSVLLYAALMANFVLVALIFHWCYPGFLPLRWRANEPFTAVPFDIVFAFLCIPPTAKALKPIRTCRVIFSRWAKYSIHKMRLSAFFFGDSIPSEEGSYVFKTWKQALTFGYGSEEPLEWKPSGDMCRVPKSDHIRLLPGRPSTIPVDAQGNAKTPDGAATIAAQREAGLSEDDFCLVYTPPRFRMRLMFALYSLWVAGATFAISLGTVPLLVGRVLISALIGRVLHDGYAFLLGTYALYPIVYFTARHIRRSNSRAKANKNKRSSAHTSKRSKGIRRFTIKSCLAAIQQKTVKMAFKMHNQGSLIWTAFRTGVLGGLVLPLLVGTHFYLVISPLVTPRAELPNLWLPMLWCYGVAELALVYALSRSIIPHWHPVVSTAEIFAERPSTMPLQEYLDKLHTQLIKPEIIDHLKNILLPALLVMGSFGLEDALRQRGLDTSSEWFMSRQMVFKLSFAVQLAWSLQDSLLAGWQTLSSRWLEALRDQEFLIERHILNYSGEKQESQGEETVVLEPETGRIADGPEERED